MRGKNVRKLNLLILNVIGSLSTAFITLRAERPLLAGYVFIGLSVLGAFLISNLFC